MRDSRNRKSNAARIADSDRALGGSKDPLASKLTKMNARLGNHAIRGLLDTGNASRDDLVQFICQRLQVVRDVQLRELAETNMGAQRSWWKTVGDSQKEDYTKPDPTRWRETARIYEDAIQALCNGHVGRGADLLERAMQEEEKTHEATSKVVDTNGIDTSMDSPDALGEIVADQGCGYRELPPEASLAAEIQNCTTQIANPPNRGRAADPWWALEEEEEEEESDGEAG